MTASPQPAKTLDIENQFSFVCPIFDSQTKISTCFTLRELVWRNENPDVRKGCQMCMKHGKCPINNIVWDMIRKPGFDPYTSKEAKVGKLQERHLVQIERVIIPDKEIEKALDADRILPAEAKKMTAANATARDRSNKPLRKSADFELEDVQTQIVTRRSSKVVAETEEVSATVKAAMSGDMSAAVNAAMENTNEQ
jgi:hypothetical protein